MEDSRSIGRTLGGIAEHLLRLMTEAFKATVSRGQLEGTGCQRLVSFPSITTEQMFVGLKAPAPFWGPGCRIFWDGPVEGIRASACVEASVSTVTVEFAQLFSEASR